MSLLDWFRPRWRNSNPEVRREALLALEPGPKLAEAARKDPDPELRLLALERSGDVDLLRERAQEDEDEDLRARARAILAAREAPALPSVAEVVAKIQAEQKAATNATASKGANKAEGKTKAAPKAPAAKAAPKAPAKAVAKAPAKSPTKAPAAAPAAASKGSKKKARKQAAAPPPAPVAEVLSLEEAERRYGALLAANRAAPQADPTREASPPPPSTPSGTPPTPRSRMILAKLPAEAPEPEPEPSQPLPNLSPSGRPEDVKALRKRQDEEYRAWVVRPQFDALLARFDALIAQHAEPKGQDVKALARDNRALLEEWRALGPPPADAALALKDALNMRQEALKGRLEGLRQEEEAQLQENLRKKQEILARAAQAAELPDLREVDATLDALRQEYKAAGPAPRDAQDTLNAALDQVMARVQARRDMERQAARAADAERFGRLQRIVAQAEALAQTPDAQNATERIKALQADWKKIGRAGKRAEADALWQRLRAAADTVFERRREGDRAQQDKNLARKEALVARALALAEDPSQNDPESAVRALQTEWRKIGHVPKAQADAVWARFKAACEQALHPPSVGTSEEQPLRFQPFAAFLAEPGTDKTE